MRWRGKTTAMGVAASLAAAVALCTLPQPANAEGLLESIFGGLRRAIEPVSYPTETQVDRAPATKVFPAPNRTPERTVERGGGAATAFCVRTCDGHYFPLQAHAGLSVGEACRAMCPASETRVYHGRTIDTAVAQDRRRYAELPNAFAYRRHLIAGCTCNGRDAFGLAPIDPLRDPTLRPGDVVATRQGLFAFTGGKSTNTDFTPVRDYSYFSKSYRDQLSTLRITPARPGVPAQFSPVAAASGDKFAVQFVR